MHRHFALLLLVSSLAVVGHASDTTRRKTSMSINAGYTNNSVYGSMVDRNERFGENVTMTNRGGFMAGVLFESPLNQAYLKYGAYYIQKNVNPMNGTFALYKDKLSVGYVSLPFLVGIKALPPERSLNVQFEAGPSANLRVSDKSTTGPDRVGFKTPVLSVSICAGTTFSCSLNDKTKFLVQYRYLHDVTNAHIETLYWSSQEPNKEFTYKYKTHSVSLGLQWALNDKARQ